MTFTRVKGRSKSDRKVTPSGCALRRCQSSAIFMRTVTFSRCTLRAPCSVSALQEHLLQRIELRRQRGWQTPPRGPDSRSSAGSSLPRGKTRPHTSSAS